MNNIEIKNLIVKYDDKLVIDNISLSIKEGEFVTILGENGSGKSTLIKTINGLCEISDGDVLVYNKSIREEKNILDIRKLVGMTFQNPDNQIVASVVEEDVAFGLENIGVKSSEIRVRIDDAMNKLSIYDLKDKLTSRLSGGQKQKVSIAGILAMKSKIIILDEPTSMLDVKARQELLMILKKLNEEENITIILITHHIDEILYSNRTIVLKNGKIEIDDSPINLLNKYNNLDSYGIELPYVCRVKNSLKAKLKNNYCEDIDGKLNECM